MYSERVLEKISEFFQMKTIKIQKKSEFCSLPRKNSEFFQKIPENGKNSEFFQKIQSFVSCGHPAYAPIIIMIVLVCTNLTCFTN